MKPNTVVSVAVTPETEEMVAEYLSTRNLGQRASGGNGSPEQQKHGMWGQMTVSHWLTDEYPDLMASSDGFDGGVDITYLGMSIDIKTMGRNVPGDKPWYVNNLNASQTTNIYKADTYIFCSYNKKKHVVDIVGWLPKQCLELKSDYFEAGTDRERDDGTFTHCRTNMFEIPNSDLLDISYLKQ